MTDQDDKSLKATRVAIDEVNLQILQLLSQRAELAQEIARLKNQSPGEVVYYRPEREAEVLQKMAELNAGPLPDEAITCIFREIMSACLALEKTIMVAYLGPPGTYSHEVVHKHFGGAVDEQPRAQIAEVFRDVERGTVDYGVVPIENSTEGAVTHSMDLFLTSRVQVCGEVALPIQHNLLALETNRGLIKKIYSHQQSLGQCRSWLAENMPGVELHAVSSNSEAARIAGQDKHSAAIAGRIAAALYELNILATNIADQADNTTRFLVIGRQATRSTGRDKTSLVLTAGNKPGALAALLIPFSSHGISMTRIESRPSRQGRWEYVFFIDIEGHKDDEEVAHALREVSDLAVKVQVLGSYPRYILEE